MLSPSVIILVCSLYMACIVIIALWVERKAAAGKDIGNNPIIYALSLTVYHTAWTFYGSVGKAASSGMLFLAIYLGASLAIILWWVVLRKMVRIKNAYRITSIADFVSLRYNKSAAIAALVTVISIFGIVPYFALQLKAIFSTFALVIAYAGGSPWTDAAIGRVIVGFIIFFTILLGVRKTVPTERHQGMVVAMSVEGLVKLVVFLAVGIYVSYGLFEGVGDLFTRFEQSPLSASVISEQTSPSFYITWITYLLLSMSAIMFLPRQFHMAIVENFHEKHIRTAMWLFPLYMLLINFFVMPIAMGGLLAGYPVQQADTFVLMLPLSNGQALLALLVFLGGFSAATGMIMISSMTISTMATNHLLLPVIESVRRLGFLKRYLLQCRWVAVALLVMAGYWFERIVGAYFLLVDIGVISFVAVLQFAPAIIGGLYWKKGNTAGALLGMGSGFLLWAYTLILPSFVRGGLVSRAVLDQGPWGAGMFRPEQLLGVTGLDSASHAVFWTLVFNVSLYILGSLYVRQQQDEINISEEFVDALATGTVQQLPGEATIDLALKKMEIKELYCQYFPEAKSEVMIGECLSILKFGGKEKISIAELAELYHEAEIHLASSVGAAAAHKALLKSEIISHSEEKALKHVYTDIIAELKMTPSDLKRKIDYHREREKLLTLQATELEEKILELDREIAERRKAEEALRNSERRLADIIDFLPDPTFVIDAEGKIIIWNRAAEEFTGAKAENMLGKGDHEYSIPFYGKRRPVLIDLAFNPPEKEEIKRLYPRVAVEDGIIIGESATRSVKRGEAYMLGMAAPLYDSEGKIVAVIESVRDITERKQAEEELEKHRANLEELVRERTSELMIAKDRAEVASQAKSTFLSSMSHELRTPLNAILGYAQIIKRQDNLTESQRQQVEIMRTSGEHLLTLINDILDMGKIEAQKMEIEELSFDLAALLRQVFNIARIKGEEKDLAFRYEERTPLPGYVRGDQRKLKQILLNLISNAVKYTRRGSVVTRAAYNRDSGMFSCEVADTGIGIAPDQLETIFEPFTQLVDAGQIREGTGLGLSITRRLVTLMHGKVAVESEPGKGSTFRVELHLPAVSGAEISREVAGPAVTGYQGKRRRILVVDDNISNASMLVALLEPLGFELATAERGREALRQALELPPDLVLLDLVMPGMDGLETAQEMRRLRELDGTRIIGTSATVSSSERKDAFEAVCDDFLAKPIGLEMLLEKIGRHLGIAWETELPGMPVAAAAMDTQGLEEPLRAPGQGELAQLHGLALMGDMQGIRSWAAKLEEREPEYSRFAGRLRDLAGSFKAKAILELVEQHMKARP